MQNIFDYNNYREFLKDHYEEQKSKKTGFTYARFSKEAGIASPNYYKLVMDGQKNLTPANIIRFTLALKLQDQQRDYFEALVHWNQADSTVEGDYYVEKIKRLRETESGGLSRRLLQEYEFEFLSSWAYHAIMLLPRLRSFRESPRWISKQLYGMVSESEAAAILLRLEALGLIHRDKSGRLRQTHKRVRTLPELKRESVQAFYAGLLQRASKAFSVESPENREFGAYMVGLSKKQLPEMKKKVRAFLNDLNEWAMQNEDPEQIYALVFSGFPLSASSEEKICWS